MPLPLFACLVLLLTILASCTGLWAVRRWVRPAALRDAKEVTGIFFGALSLIHSLVLAFAFIAVWEDYEELRSVVSKETEALKYIQLEAEGLPAERREEVRTIMTNYVQGVVNVEWDATDKKGLPNLLTALQRLPEGDSATRGTIHKIKAGAAGVIAQRRDRLDHTTGHVPPLVWIVLAIGTVVVAAASWLLWVESGALHAFLCASLAAMMALCLLVIYRLDHPMDGVGKDLRYEYEALLGG